MVEPFEFFFPNKNMAFRNFLVTDRYMYTKYFGFLMYIVQGTSTISYVLNNVEESADLIVFNLFMIIVFIVLLVS